MKNSTKKKLADFGNNISLKYKLIILVSLLYIVFASIVNYMTFSNASNALLEETLDVMISNLTQINNSINYNAQHHEVALNAFCSASKLDQHLATQTVDNDEEFLIDLKQSILSFKGSNPNVIDLKIFTYNDNLPVDDYTIFDIESFRMTSLLDEILDVTGGVDRGLDSMYSNTVWSNIGDGTWNKFGYIPAVYCYKVLYDEALLQPLAILRMDVTTQSVFSGLEAERLSKSLPGEFFVANSNANVIFSSSDERLGLYQYKSRVQEVVKLGDDQGYFNYESLYGEPEYICYQKNDMDWYTIYRVPTATLFANIAEIRDYSMAITITFLFITLVAAVILIHLSTRRLLKLSSDIGKFSKDNTNIDVHVSGRDEVGKVAKSVKDMLQEIDMLLLETHQQKEREKELMNENYSKELLRREAEFKALQMQINPHFLYNTLEMIKGLVYSEDPQQNIITATQALADMFRYNINDNYNATIRDEIEHIKAYLIIQNFRFDKTITLNSSLPEEIMETPIVRFTLEPLVENAIVHGFWSVAEQNNLFIDHEVEDGKLIIRLKDDGVGIEPNMLEEIKNRLKYGATAQTDTSRRSSIGLQNVHLRLKQFFGADYGLRIESTRGEGTTLFIVIPMGAEKQSGEEGDHGHV